MSKTVEIKNSEDMVALIKRINKNDPKPEDLEALSKEMDKYPELYRSSGNISKYVFNEILDKLAQQQSTRIIVKKNIEEMKNELGYAHSTFVEKMLIEEILLRWLRLHHAELDYNAAIYQNHTLEIGTYNEKRIDLHHKRFLRSIETLAKVRKMIANTQAKGAEMFKNLMSK